MCYKQQTELINIEFKDGMLRHFQVFHVRITCEAIVSWASFTIRARFSSSSLRNSKLLASNHAIFCFSSCHIAASPKNLQLSFRDEVKILWYMERWWHAHAHVQHTTSSLLRLCGGYMMWGNCKYVSTWTSVVDGPPPRAQMSSACITSNCCLIRCISAAIGSRLTVGLFWMFRARLAYFKVLRVSSAFESAGLTQAA